MDQGDKTATLNTQTDPCAQIIQQPIGVRRLTPLECERLQGFPDEFTRYGNSEAVGEKMTREIELSDSARYFVLGNAVTVNVAHWIGIGIKQMEK